ARPDRTHSPVGAGSRTGPGHEGPGGDGDRDRDGGQRGDRRCRGEELSPPATAAPKPCPALRPADSTPWTWPRTWSGVDARSCSWSGRVAANPAPATNTAAVSTGTGGWRANSR